MEQAIKTIRERIAVADMKEAFELLGNLAKNYPKYKDDIVIASSRFFQQENDRLKGLSQDAIESTKILHLVLHIIQKMESENQGNSSAPKDELDELLENDSNTLTEKLREVKKLSELEKEEINSYIFRLDDFMQNTKSHWSTILLLSNYVSNTETLVKKIINKEDKDSLLLGILCLKNAQRSVGELFLKIFFKLNHYYHNNGQIPTYIIADELKGIGRNGIEPLSRFLEKNYYEDMLKEIEEFNLFVKEVRGKVQDDIHRPYEMTRRTAIDTLGNIRNNETKRLLMSALVAFHTYSTDAEIENDKYWLDEWQHNQWHICFAIHKNQDRETFEFLNSFINEKKLDTITYLECCYHIYNYLLFNGADQIELNKFKAIFEKSIPDLEACLKDKFSWRRGHACETIHKLATCNSRINKLIYDELFDTVLHIALIDSNPMVQHYACLSIGNIGNIDSIHHLLSIASDTKKAGWAKYASLIAIELILKRLNSKMLSDDLEKLRKLITINFDSTKNKQGIPTVEDIVFGISVRILGNNGDSSDIEVLKKVSHIDKDVMIIENIKHVALDAIRHIKNR